MIEDIEVRTVLAKERTVLAAERNRLANERTYLAWIRTGLASVGGGFAIIRFLSFQSMAHQLLAQGVGCVLIALGVALFLLSFLDYRQSYKKFQVQRTWAGSLCAVGAITIILTILSIVLLFIAFRIAD